MSNKPRPEGHLLSPALLLAPEPGGRQSAPESSEEGVPHPISYAVQLWRTEMGREPEGASRRATTLSCHYGKAEIRMFCPPRFALPM